MAEKDTELTSAKEVANVKEKDTELIVEGLKADLENEKKQHHQTVEAKKQLET